MKPFGHMFAGLFGGTSGGKSLEQKKSAVSGLRARAETAWLSPGTAYWTGRTYDQLSREGYRKNVVVHRSVRIVAESLASVPFTLYRGDQRLDRHPLLDLLRRPNPMYSGKELIENLIAFLQISGNSYLESVDGLRGDVAELYTLRPDRMSVVPGINGWPERYDYKVGGQAHHFHVDQKSGQSPIMHMRLFHPLDDHYGLSPLEACAFGIDIHNSSQNWNKAMLDNAARPSGALVFEPREGEPGSLSDDQFSRLKDELEDQYQGAKNAGRPFLLEGGLKWQQIALSPQDMEFIQSKHVSAREIALAFGVPPMLLGIPGDNTYANYAEANRALWRLTLLPLMEKLVASLNGWLVPRFEEDRAVSQKAGELRLDFDRDAIPALAMEREALWSRIGAAGFLTPNEKRALLGYDAIDGGDKLPDPASYYGSAPGGGPGFFSQAAVSRKSGCGCSDLKAMSLEEKAGARAATEARFKRLLRIQREYEEEVGDNSDITYRKHWVHVPGAGSSRSSHKSIASVGLNEPFRVAGESLFLPCDPSGSPDNTFNCRCRVEYQRLQKNAETGEWEPSPISYGDKAYLTDEEIAEIIFNEHSILWGTNREIADRMVAHVLMNGEERLGRERPRTVSTFGDRKPTMQEQQALDKILEIVKSVRYDRVKGMDPVSGRIFYNHRQIGEDGSFDSMMARDRQIGSGFMPQLLAIGPLNVAPGGAVPAGSGGYLLVQDGTSK